MNYFNKKLACIPLLLLVFSRGNTQPIQVQGSAVEIEAAKHEITTQLQQMQALRGDANQIALARESNRLALINAAKDAQQNSQSAKLAINSSLSEATQTDKAEIQTRNRIDIANVTQEQMDAVRRKSGLEQFGSKVAQYVTGSPILANSDQGRNVITLIKGLGNPGEQAKNLALIRQYRRMSR